MSKKDFIAQYDDEIREMGEEVIRENKEEYFDGYTAFSDNDYLEVLEEHYDDFVYMYAELAGILIEEE